jgi:hypothetical protein
LKPRRTSASEPLAPGTLISWRIPPKVRIFTLMPSALLSVYRYTAVSLPVYGSTVEPKYCLLMDRPP